MNGYVNCVQRRTSFAPAPGRSGNCSWNAPRGSWSCPWTTCPTKPSMPGTATRRPKARCSVRCRPTADRRTVDRRTADWRTAELADSGAAGQRSGRPRSGRQGTGRQGTGRQGTGRQGTGRQGPGRQGPGTLGLGTLGLAPYVASLYEVPLLTREQEVHLFRKLNYLKFKIDHLRGRLKPSRPQRKLLARIEKLYGETVATRNQIICANLRLVVSIAKRYVGPGQNFFELVSDGNLSLMRAVEWFDYSLGNRFSTYATWAIINNFSRSIQESVCYRNRFRSDPSGLLTASTRPPRTATSWRPPNPAVRARWTASCGGSTIASGRLSSAATASAAAISRRPCSKWATSWV